MKTVKFLEVETKYDAKAISLFAFKTACIAEDPSGKCTVESYDHYYTKGRRAIRHRAGTRPELTVKRKLASRNNFSRVEVNLSLKGVQDDTVKALCSELGYKHNFSIYKHSTIYWYKGYNTVFYTVYSDHTKSKELGRFIEIEMDEHYPWKTKQEPWTELKAIEKKFSALGLCPRTRLKKSLFEMFVR